MSKGRTYPPRPGIREVAERAGVAISSVSRVLSGHSDVSPEMRQAVMTVVDELGYRPNLLAAGLRSQKTMSIGYVVSNISNPVLADIVTGAESRLRASGYSLVLTNSEGVAALDASNMRVLLGRRIDGLLLSLTREDDASAIEAIRELDVPFVIVDRFPPPGMDAWCVAYEHQAGMAAATRHLMDYGHRNVGLIIGGPRRPARDRLLGVEETLQQHADAVLHTFDGDFSVDHGIAATRRILSMTPRPTAIIAGGNLLLQGALRVIYNEGIRLGTELSLVGCDDVIVADLYEPQIAIVRRDLRAGGVAAADLLIAALADRNGTPQTRTLPTEFIARASCGPVPTS
jgi:LacI family transcriptional regulator, galactose operon repressor